MKQNNKIQPYKDGVATIYSAANSAEKGNRAKLQLTEKIKSIRYDELVVGITRYNFGKQNRMKIDQLLRMPRINTVTTDDIVKASDGNQYLVVQVQYPKNVYPSSMDLSLERKDEDYDIAGA